MSKELQCDRCASDYPIWFTDNDSWNIIAQDKYGNAFYHFLCLNCFANLYDKKFERQVWELKISDLEQNTSKDSYGIVCEEIDPYSYCM